MSDGQVQKSKEHTMFTGRKLIARQTKKFAEKDSEEIRRQKLEPCRVLYEAGTKLLAVPEFESVLCYAPWRPYAFKGRHELVSYSYDQNTHKCTATCRINDQITTIDWTKTPVDIASVVVSIENFTGIIITTLESLGMSLTRNGQTIEIHPPAHISETI